MYLLCPTRVSELRRAAVFTCRVVWTVKIPVNAIFLTLPVLVRPNAVLNTLSVCLLLARETKKIRPQYTDFNGYVCIILLEENIFCFCYVGLYENGVILQLLGPLMGLLNFIGFRPGCSPVESCEGKDRNDPPCSQFMHTMRQNTWKWKIVVLYILFFSSSIWYWKYGEINHALGKYVHTISFLFIFKIVYDRND